IAPALAMMVLIQASIINHMGSGPFWSPGNGYLSRVCRESWWGTLLFVQNYIDADKLCLPHSWYAMVDLQLYLFSPLILLFLLQVKKVLAVFTAVIFIILGIISTFFVDFHYDLPAAILRGGSAKSHLRMKYEYVTAYTRLAPWLTGMLFGYLIHRCRSIERDRPYTLLRSKKVLIGGWILVFTCFAVAIFAIIPVLDDAEDNKVDSSLYSSLSPALWALAVCWVILSCETGHGGIIHRVLSLKVFQPLQRLSYCVYLVHLPFMTYKALLTRVPIHVDKTTGITAFFGEVTVSFSLAIILCLLVELPFRRIFKTISINYGFPLRYTEERFVTRRASECSRIYKGIQEFYYARWHGYREMLDDIPTFPSLRTRDSTPDSGSSESLFPEPTAEASGTGAVSQPVNSPLDPPVGRSETISSGTISQTIPTQLVTVSAPDETVSKPGFSGKVTAPVGNCN
ncbi:hypothetical protein L9F63_015472, partial [Diploptera punctata]